MKIIVLKGGREVSEHPVITIPSMFFKKFFRLRIRAVPTLFRCCSNRGGSGVANGKAGAPFWPFGPEKNIRGTLMIFADRRPAEKF